MSDFFTHLAVQTLGLAPVVEPVIAPMYAPGPSTDSAFLETEQLVEPAQSPPYEISDLSPQPPGLVRAAEMTAVEEPPLTSPITLPPVLPADTTVPQDHPRINEREIEAEPEIEIAPPLLPASETPARRDMPEAPGGVMPTTHPDRMESQPLLVPVLYQPNRSEAIPEEAGQAEHQELLQPDSLPGLVSATRDQQAIADVAIRRKIPDPSGRIWNRSCPGCRLPLFRLAQNRWLSQASSR